MTLREVGQKREAGVNGVVTIGSLPLKRYSIIVVPGVIVESDVDVSLDWIGGIRMSAGSPIRVDTDTPQTLRTFTVARNAYTDGGSDQRRACLTDKDRDGTFDMVSANANMGSKKLVPCPSRTR